MIHDLTYPASAIWLAAGAVTLLTSGLVVKLLLQVAGEPTPLLIGITARWLAGT